MNKDNVRGYCIYCKNPIFKQNAYTVYQGEMYHPSCWEQATTYTDDDEGYMTVNSYDCEEEV